MSRETIKISNSDFIQKIMKLDGHNWRLKDRPYIFPIINNTAKRTLLLAARQTEKSTTMSGNQISTACLNPNYNLLYVSPTMKQTNVYSRKKIDEVFEISRLLRKTFYPGVKGFRVEEKKLKNFTTMYFRSAYHDADSIRGITADGQYHDEVQDMLQDIIPVIEACSQKRKNAKFMYAGTPKTFDNNIHLQWNKSTQNEWHPKCLHCGYYNLLGIDNILLDKPGLWCKKCQRDIHTRYGCWVSAQEKEIQGFRLPYIILPTEDLDFKELFFKMRNYDTASLMNEVFGVSYDNGKKPLTREQLIGACSIERSMWYELPDNFKNISTYAGIDWGGGTSGYTILTISYFDTTESKFKIIFMKKFVGREAEPEEMLPIIASLIMKYNAYTIGADSGFGFGLNDRLVRMLPNNYTYAKFSHSAIKKYVAYNEHNECYMTNRTEVMTDLFNKIKSEKVQPFKWSEFEYYGQDYLNINSEYSETLRQLRYIHTQPDDAFHSTLYAFLVWTIETGQQISTRYDPSNDDIEPNKSRTDD